MSALSPVAPAAMPVERQQAEKAAGELEAHFLTYMLQQMRGEHGLMGSSPGASTYQGILEEQLGQTLAQSSPLGMRDVLTQAMLGAEQTRNTAPAQSVFAGMTMTSSYGVRKHPISGETSFHHGWDLGAPEGTPVRAPRDGVVVFSGEAGGYGQLIELQHDDGTRTRYGHLSRRGVEVGTRVGAGTSIGNVGSSGRSTGPHLHFEVRRGGESVEPGGWLSPGLNEPGRRIDVKSDRSM